MLARLRRQPRPSRRRRRRRACVDRRLPGGVPGGRDHPAGEGRPGREDRGRRLPPDPRPDPVEARDGGRLPRPDRGQRDGRAADHGAVRAATAARRSSRRWTSCSSTRSGACARRSRSSTPGTYAAEGTVDNDGYTDQPVRLQVRIEITPDGVHFDTIGIGSAAARAGQLDVRDDLLGLCLRAQVPDRPRPAGERRLLPAVQPQRAGGHGHELHLARAGRRRLGDPDPARRGDVPRAHARVPGAAPGGHQGDDVPGGLRLPRRRQGKLHVLLRGARRGATAAGTGATARTRCRRTARTPRTRRSRRRS